MATRPLPDGYYHGRITLALAAGSLIPAAVACATTQRPDYLLVPLGILIGLILDPDLDQPMVTSSEWRVKKSLTSLIPLLGHLLAGVWVGWWFAYATIMSSSWPKKAPRAFRLVHRGLSHTPILGTLTRVLWILPLYILLHELSGFTITQEHAIMLVCGLTISDLGHYLRDSFG